MLARFKLALLAAALASSTIPAVAEPLPTPPAPERIAAAERLMAVMHYDSLLDKMTERTIADLEKNFPERMQKASNNRLPPELVARIQSIVAKRVRSTMQDHRGELKRGFALIYASHFTVPELEHLAGLQKDPVMVKIQSELPAIAAEGSELSRALASQQMPQLKEEITAAIKDYFRGNN